jgi:hypothetical protein
VVYEDKEGMLKYATSFYKKLFGEEPKESIHLGDRFWKESEKVTQEKILVLEENFSEEIKRDVDCSYSDGALGQDGFSFMFYQKFWKIIKDDLMALVKEFEQGKVDMSRLNYVIIILIPKEDDAKTLKHFRLISLINYSFKIFAKAMNNRLEMVCNRLLAPNQTTFVKGRFILESVVSAHEIIHRVVRSKEKGVILKLDYENAYDRVSWQFLEELLVTRGYGKNGLSWCSP